MNSNVLKEFLIAIGFHVDEEQFKKMNERVEAVTAKIMHLGKQAAEASTVIAVAVTRVASDMEKMYFASQRTGASVTNLKSFAFAAQQIGVDAGQALSVVEGLAAALRDNPGKEAWLAQLGIDPNQDRVKVLFDLVDKLKGLPFYQARLIAGQFGIDENTLLMLEKNNDELKKNFELRQQMARKSGVDEQDLANKSHKFMSEIRGLGERFEFIAELMEARFLPVLDKLLPILDKALDLFIRLDKATDGWSTRIAAVGAALGLLRVPAMLTRLLGIGGIGGGAGVAGVEGVEAASGPAGWIALGLTAAGVGAYQGYKHREAIKKWVGHAKDIAQKKIADVQGGAWGHNWGNLRHWGASNPEVERFSHGQSIGKFAQFGSDEEGLSAMAGQLYRDAARGMTTVQQLVSKYAPKNENNTEAYIRDVAQRLHTTANAQLNFLNRDTMRELMKAMVNHEQGKERAGTLSDAAYDNAITARLGADGTRYTSQISQHTEINVNGTDSPAQTGREVARQQRQVNDDMFRNMKPAVQ